MRTMQVLSALLALLPLPLQAQQPVDDGGGDTIVVDGQRLTRQEVRERASGFVRTLGVVQGDRGIARWMEPVCPQVRGVASDIADLVEAKVRKIATSIGAPLAKSECETNFLIVFVDDGREMARQVSARKSNSMSQLHGSERRDVENGDAPIRWWYTIATGSSTGGKADSVAPSASVGNSEGGSSALIDGVPTVNGFSSSLIRPIGIRSIDTATVLIDVNRAEGISLTAAAAYAAFVGLAEVKGRAAPPVSSILNIFGDGAQAGDLTFWDNQFLDQLYDLPLNRWGRVHRGYLVRAIGEAEGEDVEEGATGPVEP